MICQETWKHGKIKNQSQNIAPFKNQHVGEWKYLDNACSCMCFCQWVHVHMCLSVSYKNQHVSEWKYLDNACSCMCICVWVHVCMCLDLWIYVGVGIGVCVDGYLCVCACVCEGERKRETCWVHFLPLDKEYSEQMGYTLPLLEDHRKCPPDPFSHWGICL